MSEPMPKKKRVTHYVNNRRLYEEMVTYIEQVNIAKEKELPRNEWPQVSNYIGEAIFMIANKLSNKYNFSGYSYKDEMIFDGIENCLLYIHNYKLESKNPFAYFTRIIWNAFIRRIQKEQKENYIKHKSLLNHSVDMMLAGFSNIDKLDISREIVDKYEERIREKKRLKEEKTS